MTIKKNTKIYGKPKVQASIWHSAVIYNQHRINHEINAQPPIGPIPGKCILCPGGPTFQVTYDSLRADARIKIQPIQRIADERIGSYDAQVLHTNDGHTLMPIAGRYIDIVENQIPVLR